MHGAISVEDPKAGVTIVLPNGTVRQIKPSDVKRTVYGGGLGSATAPAPAPAAAPPPFNGPVAPPPAHGDDGVVRPRGRAGGASWAKPLWITSLVTFSFAYALPIIGVNAVNATAYRANWANSGFVTIPFAGPWIVVGNASKYIPDYASAMLGLHAVLQTAAAIGFIVGVSNRGEKSAAGTTAPRWAVLPAIGPNQAGLTLTITGF